jgi:phospholipid/cholesterol/gamma-HCH transport system permease protein
MIADGIARLGASSLAALESLGRVAQFGGAALRATPRASRRGRRLVDEIYATGVLSLSIITVSGAAVGMVLGLNGYHTLIRYGAEENLGAIVAITLVRELGPVLTALLLAGRAGSAAAGEIGSMVATEQIDGLRMMAIDPLDFVIWPKLTAFLVATPLLSAMFIACGLCGGYLAGVGILGVDAGSYLAGIEASIAFADEIAMSQCKALAFGLLVGLIATYHGYTAAPHVAGVSRATTASVVAASVSVLISDYVITALWEA